MSRFVRNTALGIAAVLLGAHQAAATITANGPDDICLPTADPCVISDTVEVQSPGDLDFGLRTVHITGSGKIEGTATISCGALLVDVGSTKTAFDIKGSGSTPGGTLTVNARRACSVDGLTACFDDALCAGSSLGTCSVGDGSISVDGKILGAGSPGGEAILRSAGDISYTDGTIKMHGADQGAPGGVLEMESFQGSVTLDVNVDISAGAPGYYLEPDDGGALRLAAAVDVTVNGSIDTGGGFVAGLVDIDAGRDITVANDVNNSGGNMPFAYGGEININAGRDLVLYGPAGRDTVQIRANGGDGLSYYEGTQYGGAGGYSYFIAGSDITVGEKVVVEGNSGKGKCEGGSYGGPIYFQPQNAAKVYGTVRSDASGECSIAGKIEIDAPAGINIADGSLLSAVAKRGGNVKLTSDAVIAVDGKIDVKGHPPGANYYLLAGDGGEVVVTGMADVTVGGQVLGGSGGAAEAFIFDVCRLALTGTGKIDATHGNGSLYGAYDLEFSIGESMTAEAGTKILAEPQGGADVRISYRDPAKPPALLGQISPSPILSVDPSLTGCPVCGNSEIDQFESCDDGNTTSGDGCRDDCQDETCIAETPGFPGTSLCDDSDPCTIDTCIPGGAGCDHLASCEEGVACTVDACAVTSCTHTPDDLLCDDGNDCTDDVCNATTGCVYANLTGNGCEDGDFCTVTGTCATGDCQATDVSLGGKGKIVVRFKPGPDDDKASMKGELPLAEFTSDPTSTGLEVLLFDEDDVGVYSAQIPAGLFEDLKGDGSKFRYRASDASPPTAAGVRAVSIRLSPTKGVAKAKIKLKDFELPGALGQSSMSLSLLFGADPALDECLTLRSLPCSASSARTKCKE